MHIPDNYLSPQTDAVMAVAMVPVWVHCIKKVRATLDREHMAFLGICAAFSFLLMMFNVPLPGGTTGHAVGGALIALLLGPEAATIAVSVALALQALLFGDGGVLSFGANCFNMAFVLPFVAAIVFRALNSRLHDKSWGTSASAIVSGWVGLCVAALCAAIEFGIQPMLFTTASGAHCTAPSRCPWLFRPCWSRICWLPVWSRAWRRPRSTALSRRRRRALSSGPRPRWQACCRGRCCQEDLAGPYAHPGCRACRSHAAGPAGHG